jgi:hypothetical protein
VTRERFHEDIYGWADATASAHHDRRVLAAIGAVYERPADMPTHQAWVNEFAAVLVDTTPGVHRLPR